MTKPTTTDTAHDLRAVPDSADPRAVAEAILFEVRRVIVGQDQMLERILVGLLSGGHILLEGVPGPRQDPDDQDPCRRPRRHLQAHPVHPGPDALGPRRHPHLPPVRRLVRDGARPGLRELPARRRDQPRPGQGPVGPARGHAGAPGHDRRRRPTRSRSRSSSWPPRTRSRRRAPTRCPRPRSTGSCSRSCSAIRSATEEAQIVARSLRPGLPPREVLDAEGLAALQRRVEDVYVDPTDHQLRGRPRRGDPRAQVLGRPGARVVRRLRRQPAWLDQPRRRRSRACLAARSSLRPAVRRRRAGPRRPPPPPRPVLRRPDRRHHAGRVVAAGCLPSSRPRSSTWPARGAATADRRPERGVDLAGVAGRERTAARPGPGPIAEELVRRLEIALTRRAGGRLTGDHRGLGLGEGLDLDRLRPYEPGDDVRRIDWNATARSRHPAGPRGRARSPADGVAPARPIRLDALRDRRPAQGRCRRGRRPRRRALRRATLGPARRHRVRAPGAPGRPPPAGGRNGMLGLLRTLADEPAGRGRRRRRRSPTRCAPSRRRAPRPASWRSSPTSADRSTGARPLTEVAGRHTVLAIEVDRPTRGDSSMSAS